MFLYDLSILAEENSLTIDIIIVAFVSVIKSNFVLIIDNLFIEDRVNFFITIVTARENFNQLCEVAAMISFINSRSRLITFRQSRASIFIFALIVFIKNNLVLIKRVKEFRFDQKRSNVHIDLHYIDHLQKYELVNNCNVLIGENKHRWFKKIIYNINFTNVKKHLLRRENM